MADGNAQESNFKKYIDVLNDLDERREGLDFEISDLLEEIDT